MVIAGYAPSLVNFRGPLLRAMVARGHEVLGAAPDLDPDTRAMLCSLGVLPVPVMMKRRGLNPLSDLASLVSLSNVMVKMKPDLVLAYTVKPVIYGMLAARWAGVSTRVALVTGLGHAFARASGGAGVLARWSLRVALKRAHLVILQNPDDREFLVSRGYVSDVRAVVVDGSGVDLEHFAAAPLHSGPTVFLSIARLLSDKGVREFVAAARTVMGSYPDTQFRLVGPIVGVKDAVTREELEEWMRDGLVSYAGELQDVRPELRAAHVFVLPSYYGEGTPRSVLEAMATGRAIITTDMPGCRETVREGHNGFLVPPRDVSALENAMRRFLEEPSLTERMGAASLEMVRTRYDVNDVNADMLAHLQL